MDIKEYSEFTQKYIEIVDNFRGLQGEVMEYKENGEDIPEELKLEFVLYMDSVEKMDKEGEERFGKTPKQLYKDGWDYWFKEDAILRELRYGGK